MSKCSYILDSGKECRKKTHSNLKLCQMHQMEQKGGYLSEIIFPMGKSLGYLTFSLFRLNEMFQGKMDKKIIKKNKNKNKYNDEY